MADIKVMIQMKKRHFDVETDGFYGAYWKCKTGSDCAMIAMIGDDPEDYLARTSVKWLHKLGVNVTFLRGFLGIASGGSCRRQGLQMM